MIDYEKLGIVSEDGKKIFSGVYLDQGLSYEEAKERYKKRREDFVRGLKHPVVIFGLDKEISSEVWHSLYTPINQEPLMLFLTGINQSRCALFLDPKEKKEILFIGKRDALKEFWNGAMLGVDDEDSKITKALVGIDDVRLFDEMYVHLSKYIDETELNVLGVLLHDGYDMKNKKAFLLEDCNYRNFHELRANMEKRGKLLHYRNILDYQFKRRLSLDDVDIKNMKRANEIHKEALLDVLKTLKDFRFENEVAAKLLQHFYSKSSKQESFATICAGGKNATCLHYVKNDDPLIKGELLLLDSGVRCGSVMNDVTRTFPVNGKFDPMQRILYGIVLDSQKEVEKKARPGVAIAELDQFAWDFIMKALDDRFVKLGGEYKLLYDKKPHGIGHLLGEMVHDGDIFRNYQYVSMEKGWVITNEPGLYGRFEIVLDGKKYAQWIGIRIEDNLQVLEDGCLNLSKDIPKEIDEIERLMR